MGKLYHDPPLCWVWNWEVLNLGAPILGRPLNFDILKKLGVLKPKAGPSLFLTSGACCFAFAIYLLYNTFAYL